MEGNSVNRFKEILKVFTNYGLGYLLGKKEDNIELGRKLAQKILKA